MDRRSMLHFGLLAALIFINEAADSPAKLFMEGLSSSNTDSTKRLNKFFNTYFLSDPEFQKMLDAKKQFVAAARLQVEGENVKMPDDSKILFWENSLWSEYKKTKDCDPQCKKHLDSLTTRGTSYKILGKTTIHTELKMLYGEIGTTQLMKPAIDESHIVVMYTYSVPCSQLRCKGRNQKANYAECAGDLKNYRQAKVVQGNPNPMIITIYSDVYENSQNIHRPKIGKEQTNERVSNLYLAIGGIPSYKLTTEGRVGQLHLQNERFEDYITTPSAQIFPRLTFARGYDKKRRFLKCIIEDDGILSEVMNIEFINQLIAFLKADKPQYKEVVYRIMTFYFTDWRPSRPTRYDDFLRNVDIYVRTKLHKPSARDHYRVCKEYGEYFDGELNLGFHENLLFSGRDLCVSILFFDNGLFEEVLCGDSDDEERFKCAESICNLTYSQRPNLSRH